MLPSVRIGLASDSDGNLDALAVAFDAFARAGVEQVFFLGERWADVDAVLSRAGPRAGALSGKLTRVASRGSPEAEAGAPTKVVDLIDGQICCLVHDKAELTREDIGNATLLFHGNSGKAGLVQIGPRVFVTPGHLRASGADDGAPSFAILELGAADAVLTVYGADGAEQRKDRASFGGGGGKVSVK